MVKLSFKLFLLLVVLAVGTFGTVQAAAVQDLPDRMLLSDDQIQVPGDLIFEMDGGIAGGLDGDPDSAGDGLGFMDGSILDGLTEGLEPGGELWDELLRIWLQRLLPQPE